jgi:hypothetical protein
MGETAVQFPGTLQNYVSYCDQSYDDLNACLEEWSVLTPACSNQDFNVQDGDVWTWSRGWPLLCEYYGTKAAKPSPNDKNEVEVETRTPSPRDGTTSVLKNRINITAWSKKPEVREAFDRLQKKHNLDAKVFDKTWWPLLDFLFGTLVLRPYCGLTLCTGLQWDCK